MFRTTFHNGKLSVFYSIGSKPLEIWDQKVVGGHIDRIPDEELRSLVLDIGGVNVITTYITCPADPKKTLGIRLPFFVMLVKNLKQDFTFEVQVLDDRNVKHRFRHSTYHKKMQVSPSICTMPLRLDDGWNQIHLNLSELTKQAYGSNYAETLRVQIHANCRLRRVYFADRLYSEDELPAEFKLYRPVPHQARRRPSGPAGPSASGGPQAGPSASAGPQAGPSASAGPQAGPSASAGPAPATRM